MDAFIKAYNQYCHTFPMYERQIRSKILCQ